MNNSNSRLLPQKVFDLESLDSLNEQQEESFFASDLAQALRKNWKPALNVAGSVFVLLFLATVLQTPLYQSETLILLDKKQQGNSILPEDAAAAVALQNTDDLSTEIEILRSSSLVSSAMKANPSLFAELTLKDVRDNLVITQAGDADVLIVSYINQDPQRSQAILKILGSTYVEYSLNRQRSRAANGVDFIDEQLPQAKKELTEITQAVREFRQEYGMVDPDAYAVKLSEQKQSLAQLLKDAKTNLNAKEQEYKQLKSQLGKVQQDPEQALAYAVLSEDAVYQNLANKLSELESDYALVSTKYKTNHPSVVDLGERREATRQLLLKRAKENLGETSSKIDIRRASPVTEKEGIKQNLTSKLIEAETAIVGQKAQLEGINRAQTEVLANFRELPRLQQNFGELQRQLQVKSKTVNFLLQKQQELDIAKAQEIAPWEIIEPPLLPDVPISPNKTRGTMLALVAGCLSGIATAMLIQRFDPKVKQVEEIRRITDLPMLGAIPKVSTPEVKLTSQTSEPQLTPTNYNYSAFTESLRSVAMNLRYLVSESGKIKSISITSANAAEGKSTITYNLALVLADLGLRVLVVDADLRKPKLHQLADLDNETGLSTAIAMEQNWSDLVVTGRVANVHILTSGPKSPNPVAMLNSPKMKEMIAEWSESYDYVLIDTPPASLMADAQTIASQVDGLIFVAGIDKGNRGGIRRALEQLRETNIYIAGFVANLIDKSHSYYAYSYHDYYQSYGNSELGNANGNGKKKNSLLRSFQRGDRN
jgi:polysaccharide biosynthesis transport protein